MGKDNDWKARLGVVYSTNKEFDYDYDEDEEADTLKPNLQHLRVMLDRRAGNKKVTLVTGYKGKEGDLRELAKKLKSKCGVGGSAKNAEILIQGDFRDRVVAILEQEGYNVKKSGG